jgi:hypothetical protein
MANRPRWPSSSGSGWRAQQVMRCPRHDGATLVPERVGTVDLGTPSTQALVVTFGIASWVNVPAHPMVVGVVWLRCPEGGEAWADSDALHGLVGYEAA